MKNKLPIIAVITAVLVGGMWGFSLTIGNNTEAKDQVFVPGPKTNATIESLKDQYKSVSEYEAAHGCVEKDQNGQMVFCGKSKERIESLGEKLQEAIRKNEKRSPKDIDLVKKNIRAVTENPSADVVFYSSTKNPYTDKEVEYYRDTQGTLYIVDPTNNAVVAFTSNARFVTPEDKRLSMEELRSLAKKYLATHVVNFQAVKEDYKYAEYSKGGEMYAFRYDAPSAPEKNEMPPFIQVKFSADGKLIGFSDTRSLY